MVRLLHQPKDQFKSQSLRNHTHLIMYVYVVPIQEQDLSASGIDQVNLIHLIQLISHLQVDISRQIGPAIV